MTPTSKSPVTFYLLFKRVPEIEHDVYPTILNQSIDHDTSCRGACPVFLFVREAPYGGVAGVEVVDKGKEGHEAMLPNEEDVVYEPFPQEGKKVVCIDVFFEYACTFEH